MRYLPVLVDLADSDCLVVGGGNVALRKAELLERSGATVHLVAPDFCAELEALADRSSRITLERRQYQPSDLAGARIAFAATDDPAVQQALVAEARALGVWLNVVDDPGQSTFIMPAIAERGGVTIAVSTEGASPALAQLIRNQSQALLGPEHAAAVELLRQLRQRYAPGEARQAAFKRLIEADLLAALRANDAALVGQLVQEAFSGCRTLVDG